MTHKWFPLGILLIAPVFTVALGGCRGDKKPELDERFPQSIRDAMMNSPEDVLVGIGVAKTESDGESILLAEDRARTDIARQLTTTVHDIELKDQFNITQAVTSTFLSGSRVVRRHKDKSGAWWCLVWLPKENANLSGIKPAQDDSAALPLTLRSNRENWPDVKNAVTADGIPGWVFDYNTPEDLMCGVGAAQLDNGEEAVYLAMERARRSLARSLSAEINAVICDYYASESESYQEEGASVTSVYEYTPMQTRLLNLAKTKDGTLWVMLGTQLVSPPIKLAIPEIFLSAEERMNQAFERLSETSENGETQ